MKQPARNALAFVSADLGVKLIGFLITVYLGRTLGPDGFGLLGIGLAILGHLTFLASPGISLLEMRNVAATPVGDPSRVSAILSLRLAFALALSLAAWAGLELWQGVPAQGEIVFLYVLSLIPMALLLDWYFQGREEMGRVGVSRLITYAVYGLLVLVSVRTARNLSAAPVAFLIGNSAAALYLFMGYRSDVGSLSLRWQPSYWTVILRDNIPIGMAMLLGQASVNLPPLIIGWFLGVAAVGAFNAALKVALVFLLADRVLSALLVPVITRYLTSRRSEARFLVQVVLKSVVAAVVPIVVAGVVLAPWLMTRVFGEQYSPGILPLQILMGYVGLTVMNSVYSAVVLGEAKTRDYLGVNAMGALTLTVLLLALVPAGGIAGSAIAVVVSEAVMVFLMARKGASRALLPPPRVFLRLSFAGALFAFVTWATLFRGEIIAVTVGLSAYGVALILARAFERDEIAFLREKLL
jgi:O-antigen/teichoic acid export membrane protein